MGIVTAILSALKKAFKGKPATVAELKTTMSKLGLDDPKIMDEIVAAYKAEESSSLGKAKDIISKGDVPDKFATSVVETSEDAIKKFADEVGGDVNEVKDAITSYVNQGYEAGSYKRVNIDNADSIANIIDIQTNYSKADKLDFIDDITEQIRDNRSVNTMGLDDELIAVQQAGIPTAMKKQAEADPSKFFRDMFNNADDSGSIVKSMENEGKVMDAVNSELSVMMANFDEALATGNTALAEEIAIKVKKMKSNTETTGLADRTLVPPGTTFNAKGGLITPQQRSMSNGIGAMFKRRN